MPAVPQELLEKLDTTAMVLGYPVLVIVMLLLLWIVFLIIRDMLKIRREMRYERRRRKHTERDRYAAKSSDPIHERKSGNRKRRKNASHIPDQRHPTLELPQLYNFQEDINERS